MVSSLVEDQCCTRQGHQQILKAAIMSCDMPKEENQDVAHPKQFMFY